MAWGKGVISLQSFVYPSYRGIAVAQIDLFSE
jgi:hypothetical protein